MEKVHKLYSSRSTDSSLLYFQLLYLSQSGKVQALKRSQSIKVKSSPRTPDISSGCFCAKLTEPHVILL